MTVPYLKAKAPVRPTRTPEQFFLWAQSHSSVNISTYEGDQLRQPWFRESIQQVLIPFYLDTTALLDRELNHCNKAYVIQRNDGRILSFFLLAYEDLLIAENRQIPGIYVGLSATDRDFQKRGLIHRLWIQASLDALDWQRKTGQQLLCWATTPTPDAYFGASTFSDVEPAIQGEYSSDNLAYVEAIRKKLNLRVEHHWDHPFVLRGVARNTQYSKEEAIRIRRLCEAKKFSLFTELDIDEQRGDRLLMIGHIKEFSLGK